MIDIDLINSDNYEQHCAERFARATTDVRYHGRYWVEDTPSAQHEPEGFFIRKHAEYTKKPISEENAVLERYTITDPEHPIYRRFQAITGLSALRVVSNLQRPGMFIPWHFDRNRSFLTKTAEVQEQDYNLEQLCHFFYFHTDQEPGQFFQIGRTQLNWRAGDLYETTWWMPHATANASYSNRKVTSIIGFRKQSH
jgi:hypothetical protein